MIALLLLVVVALAIPFHLSQLRHLHQSATGGLYNEDHVLASLDSVSGDVPLPEGPPSLVIPHVTPTGPPISPRVSACVVGFTDSRAPPATA